MLSTRTPFRQVIAPGGTVQSIILLALRATEKQARSWIKNPVENRDKSSETTAGYFNLHKVP